jgi:hypothetical protein
MSQKDSEKIIFQSDKLKIVQIKGVVHEEFITIYQFYWLNDHKFTLTQPTAVNMSKSILKGEKA